MLMFCRAAVFTLALASPGDGSDADRLEDLRFLVETIFERHPEPFQVHRREVWEFRIEELETQVAALDAMDWFAGLAALAALAADGHTGLNAAAEISEELTASHLPVRLRSFEDGLFVVAAREEFDFLLGALVVEIGGRPSSEVLARATKFVSADNVSSARHRAARMLGYAAFHRSLGLDLEAAAMTVKLADGSEEDVWYDDAGPGAPNPSHSPAGWVELTPETTPRWLARVDTAYWFERLPDQPGLYCQFNVVRDRGPQTLAEFSVEMLRSFAEQDFEFLVLDLRHNGGGNNYLNQPLVHGLLQNEAIRRPGGLFVLTSPQTFSAAMACAGFIEANLPAIFVGEPTGAGPNHAGDANTHALPHSGWPLRVSELWWQWSDPRDTRRAIQPDLAAPLRFQDWRAGRDPALEAVLEFRESPDPTLLRSSPPNAAWMSKQ